MSRDGGGNAAEARGDLDESTTQKGKESVITCRSLEAVADAMAAAGRPLYAEQCCSQDDLDVNERLAQQVGDISSGAETSIWALLCAI